MWSQNFWTTWKTHEDTPKLVPDETSEAKPPIGDKQTEDADGKVDDIPEEWRAEEAGFVHAGP